MFNLKFCFIQGGWWI